MRSPSVEREWAKPFPTFRDIEIATYGRRCAESLVEMIVCYKRFLENCEGDGPEDPHDILKQFDKVRRRVRETLRYGKPPQHLMDTSPSLAFVYGWLDFLEASYRRWEASMNLPASISCPVFDEFCETMTDAERWLRSVFLSEPSAQESVP